MQPPFRRLLVCNRGEIAIRILRAATELGVRTIAIYSHEDRFSLYRFKADEAYKIGDPGQPYKAYLDGECIVENAVKWQVDAIHPGYGFLSEDAHFAKLCLDAGIKFIGPSPAILEMFGDKVKARAVAQAAGLTIIPGTKEPVPSVDEARRIAQEIGYPVLLKAVAGGGGKGIRVIDSEKELASAFERAQSEAQTSFGRSAIYLEKQVKDAKHIEVQILGDQHGNIVHLYERDCSIQRRHQKVVEMAPAPTLSQATKDSLYLQSVTLAKKVGYYGLGTVEFLVSPDGAAYFLEVNPRIQVEHTVTEMITGIDLVQASILVAAGEKLSGEAIRIESQEAVRASGVAVQCRITTEDVTANFAPDTGNIIAYRPAAGFGIRLDEGHGTAGGRVSPYYDSLLVKVTAWARDLPHAAAKMHRSLSEFRIRGIKHNIPMLKNVMRDEKFLSGDFRTNYLDTRPSIFDVVLPRDRATKLLRFIAEVSVNDPHGLGDKVRHFVAEPQLSPADLEVKVSAGSTDTAKKAFDQGGSAGLRKWLNSQKKLLLTDTTMRDAHQSLFATRLRTRDILAAAPFYEQHAKEFFSLEVWGGATFDTCLRFLKEDPWERLAQIREAIPGIMLQMLLRGDNAVGYTNYPEWVIREFIRETVRTGLDVFRIFDCLNQPDKMATAIDEVRKQGALAEVCICYTGNIIDPKEVKYSLDYYLKIARELAAMGADILCIKDMAGLLRPGAAKILIKALKEEIDLPIHLHTHDTSGAQVAMLLEAAAHGCDIVDGAVSAMSGLTSQPSLNALVASLQYDERSPDVRLEVLDRLARYWEVVRIMYKDFETGVHATSTMVYDHEIPGGQYSNLFDQAQKVGVSPEEFHQLTLRYREVNELFGNIIKVTPSSKVVGDMALLLQKQGLTGPDYLQQKPKLDYPDSVVSFFKGHMGGPYGGFPEEVRRLVLGNDAPPPGPAVVNDDDSLEQVRSELEGKYKRSFSDAEVLSHRLYPKVYKEYLDHRRNFGDVDGLMTSVFFHGLAQGIEIETDLEAGKTLVISLAGISEPKPNGTRIVFFNLNGFPREIEVFDQSSANKALVRIKADDGNPAHIGATMPGKVVDVKVKTGDIVASGDVLMVTEAMKMEYAITSRLSGKIKDIPVRVGDLVEQGDLLVEIAK